MLPLCCPCAAPVLPLCCLVLPTCCRSMGRATKAGCQGRRKGRRKAYLGTSPSTSVRESDTTNM